MVVWLTNAAWDDTRAGHTSTSVVAAVVLHAIHVVLRQTISVSVLVVPPQESTCSVATVASFSHGDDFVSWLELHCNICHSESTMAHQTDVTLLLLATTLQETGNPNGLCCRENSDFCIRMTTTAALGFPVELIRAAKIVYLCRAFGILNHTSQVTSQHLQ